MTDNKFKVGDIVIGDSLYNGYSKHKVERVTKTQAILNNGIKLKITDVKGGKSIGSSGWGTPTYKLSDEKLEGLYKQDFQIKKVNSWFNNLMFKKLSEEELEQLYNVLSVLSEKYK